MHRLHPLSSRALLEGSNLDGSGYQNEPERNTRLWNGRNTNSLTVGAVTPGTGLRKVIYAAQTHSQLSQFIGELKCTHLGKDVKVVALGLRSLLCSNNYVLFSSKKNKERSRRGRQKLQSYVWICRRIRKSRRQRKGNQNQVARISRQRQYPLWLCILLFSQLTSRIWHFLGRPHILVHTMLWGRHFMQQRL